MKNIEELKDSLSSEIKRLARNADVCVFSVYDTVSADRDPIIFEQYEQAKLKSTEGVPVNLDFNGIGVWYICYRHGETFTVRHILLKIENGRFVHQQTGVFEGFWEDWPKYVVEDKWVKSNLVRDARHGSAMAG